MTRLGIEPRTFWTYTKCSNQLSYLALEFNQLILYLCNWVPFLACQDQPCDRLHNPIPTMKTGFPSPLIVFYNVRDVFIRLQKCYRWVHWLYFPPERPIINVPLIKIGTWRGTALCNRCMDFTEPQGLCHSLSPLWNWGYVSINASRYGPALWIPHWHKG